uniref:Candidate secreted effector n=1 Tax=Meloidogyne incognita TaxID=6306 RepID=A0A914NUG3_MELIC
MKKVEELNKYKIKFLEEKRKQNNENKEELIKEDLIELLENSYLDNSKNKKLRNERGGICIEIDNINSLFDIYRQKGKNVEQKAKEDESNSEISEFDILDNENGKKKKIINDGINIEEEEENKE